MERRQQRLHYRQELAEDTLKEFVMADYKINFSYAEPRWGDLTITNCENEEQARRIAKSEVETIFPEALDVEINQVTEIE